MSSTKSDKTAEKEKAAQKDTLEESLKTVEEWAVERGHALWQLVGVKVYHRWGDGKQVTAKEYDAAIEKWLKKKVGESN